MRKIFLPLVVLLLLLVAFPASAAATTISFDDAGNSILTANTHTFTGSITTPHYPQDLTYQYEVYLSNTGTLIDSSVWTQTISQGNWSIDNDYTFSGNFSFTAQFGTHTGPMTIYLEVLKNGTSVTREALQVYIRPIQVSLNQKNNLIITEQNYQFTGMVTSYTNTFALSYEVLNKDNNFIAQSSSTSPVTATQVSTSSYPFTYEVKFTVNFGDHTGAAKVTLKATDGTRTATNTIAVILDKDIETSPTQYGEFKNRGQLISYLVKQLKTLGYGNHKNLGQALKYALKHADFSTLTNTTKAREFLKEKVLKGTVRARKPGKRLCFLTTVHAKS